VENGATRVEATATPVVVAAGARLAAVFLPRNLHLFRLLRLRVVSATGVRPAPVLLPSAREERKAENGATRVAETATPVVVAAGARLAAGFLPRNLHLYLNLFRLLRLRLFPRTPSLNLAPATEDRAGVDLAETANSSRWTVFLVMTTTGRWKGVEALSS
jgi:hypothetical protein